MIDVKQQIDANEDEAFIALLLRKMLLCNRAKAYKQ